MTALAAIKGYQQFLSPYKGFCCAVGVYTGRSGCSELGYRAISRYGLFSGLGVLKKRLALCGDLYRRFKPMQSLGKPKRQSGDCDPGIDFGDCPGWCDWGGDWGGDWSSAKKSSSGKRNKKTASAQKFQPPL